MKRHRQVLVQGNMRRILNPFLFVLGGALLVNVSAAWSQSAPTPDSPVGTGTGFKPASGPSLTRHLQMQDSQIEKLNRLHERYTPRLARQEEELARQASDLRLAQAPTTFDERKSARLLKEMEQSRQKIAADFLSVRADALKILTPVQRAQLESLSNDPRISLRDDVYYRLLLAPLDSSWPANYGPVAAYRDRSSNQRDRINGNYGVYGGYGYGRPHVGVYGGVGQGPVSIYGGVGRGGPSIGIGIGGIFGLGRYLR